MEPTPVCNHSITTPPLPLFIPFSVSIILLLHFLLPYHLSVPTTLPLHTPTTAYLVSPSITFGSAPLSTRTPADSGQTQPAWRGGWRPHTGRQPFTHPPCIWTIDLLVIDHLPHIAHDAMLSSNRTFSSFSRLLRFYSPGLGPVPCLQPTGM